MRKIISLAVLLGIGALIVNLQPKKDAAEAESQTGDLQEPVVEDEAHNDIDNKHWVTVDRLNRRSCPSINCGIVGHLFFREGVAIHEMDGGWARITERYDAFCIGGRSEYVDSGNDRCTSENGIIDGKMAEWVSAQFLATEQPADPAEDAEGIAALVAQSDDFRLHRDAFVLAAESLIERGTCTPDDLIENGGFIISTAYSSGSVYFTYCGGHTVANRLYLNVVSGEIFR